MDSRGPYALLEDPRIYRWKTWLLSMGRASVRDYLREQYPLHAGARILDVACGTGQRAEQLPGQYLGIDLNLAYVAYTRRRHHAQSAVMDATALALPGAHFDLVLAVGLCHHLPDEAVCQAAREMLRVVRGGGTVAIIDAVLPPWSSPIGRALFAMDRGRHTRPRAALSALLQPLGFTCACPNIPRSFPYHRAAFTAKG